MGLKTQAVVGHSLGGMLAVMWGKAHPEATGVVNIDGHGRRAAGQYAGLESDDVRRRVAAAEERVKASLGALSGPLPASMVDALLAQQRAMAAQLGAPESMFVESIRRTLRTGADGQIFLRPSPLGSGARMLADAEAMDMFSVYEQVLCPILIIAGTDPDPGADPELMAAYRRGLQMDLERVAEEQQNVRLKVIKGGHGLLFQQPQELAHTVLDFLNTKQRNL
jgi:pimeloyl-ACP methyl ester carboxylesterase